MSTHGTTNKCTNLHARLGILSVHFPGFSTASISILYCSPVIHWHLRHNSRSLFGNIYNLFRPLYHFQHLLNIAHGNTAEQRMRTACPSTNAVILCCCCHYLFPGASNDNFILLEQRPSLKQYIFVTKQKQCQYPIYYNTQYLTLKNFSTGHCWRQTKH